VRVIRVVNSARGVELGDRVRVADRWWPRLRGLIGHPQLTEGEGLLIESCQGVHMYWMKYAIDVAMLDKDKQVVELYPSLRPGKRSRMHWNARYALELPTGSLTRTGTEIGDQLDW
jgi:uncharacterized membrane protein (UPF0127 family)